jgi:non-ribosomal peptide synthase protein (TIGR01720 family)
VFCRELGLLYRAALAGERAALAPPVVQYADYAEWQRAGEGGTEDRAALAYWRAQLANAPYPAASAKPRESFAGAARRSDLAPALVGQLRSSMRRHSATLFLVTFAAWVATLAERHRLDDVMVLSPVANREHPEVADVVGFFVNVVALRVRLGADRAFPSVLENARTVVRDAMRHQALPFERVLSELAVVRSLAHPPLTPFAFAVEREDAAGLDLPGVTVARIPLEVTTSKTDVALFVVERGNGITARLEYHSERYDAAAADELLAAFVAMLGCAVGYNGGEVATEPAVDPGAGRIAAMLMEIWEEVLGVAVRSPDENFFHLGGDSLSSIRVVARARRRGLVLTPRQLFEHQTVAALARVVTERPATEGEQGLVVGSVALTPIQRIFLAADLPEPDHFNMAAMLRADRRLEPALVAIAVEHLMRHHDALRLRLHRGEDGWRQVIVGLDGAVPFAVADLAHCEDDAVAGAIEERAAAEQTTLDLAMGPILRVVLFDLGPGRSSRLLVIVHHLACDAVSWPILIDDLATVYEQLRVGEPIALPPKSASFQSWAERITAWGCEAVRADDLRFWRAECVAPAVRLPRLRVDAAPRIADVVTLDTDLDADTSRRVLALLAARGVSVEAACLAALATALTDRAGGTDVLVYLERHGRDVLPDVDVTRTVGWFTAVFPCRVRVAPSGRPTDTLAGVVAHLGEIPHGGAGFGAVRDALDPAWPRPEISVNYLGHDDPSVTSGWRVASESVGPETGTGGVRPTVLDLVARVVGGRLRLAWQYDRVQLARPLVVSLAERCAAVLSALAADGAGRDA